jgi:hypothetical protein
MGLFSQMQTSPNADQPTSPSIHLPSPYHEPIILQMCDIGSRIPRGGFDGDCSPAGTASFPGWSLDAFDFFLLVFVPKDIAAEPLANQGFH